MCILSLKYSICQWMRIKICEEEKGAKEGGSGMWKRDAEERRKRRDVQKREIRKATKKREHT